LKATIIGDAKINGELKVGGAKNASLPILAAILVNGDVTLKRLPHLVDVEEMLNLLSKSGVNVKRNEDVATFSFDDLNGDLSDVPSKIRASILLLGPLALKTGKAVLSYPGGCAIGSRPIDIHIEGLKKLGFNVKVGESFVQAEFSKTPEEASIKLPFPSVGATEHLMITASMMRGTTTYISNCAKEPEIVELQRFLNSMGSNVKGAGTSHIKVKGVSNFSKVDFEIMSDRIEAGTYAILSLISNGSLLIEGVEKRSLNYVDFLKSIGANVEVEGSKMIVKPSQIKAFHVETAPYPGFPTDLQPQITVLALKAKGKSTITENIFENRFGHIEELKKMGAFIQRDGKTVKISGPQELKSAELIGKDLRETAAVTLAAAVAKGKSTIENFDILFRGYERVVEKLKSIGIKITL
jgi:UDP-N-acetylglucosamine 1-carboxyvinyltransferase